VVGKARHRARLAARERVSICGGRRDAAVRERRDRAVEHRLRAQFEADRLLRGVAHLIDQRVVAKVGAKAGLLVGLFDQLQSENALGKIDRDWQVARAQANVTQLFDLDHRRVSVAWSRTADRSTLGRTRRVSTLSERSARFIVLRKPAVFKLPPPCEHLYKRKVLRDDLSMDIR
jgi:hypothetical protein